MYVYVLCTIEVRYLILIPVWCCCMQMCVCMYVCIRSLHYRGAIFDLDTRIMLFYVCTCSCSCTVEVQYLTFTCMHNVYVRTHVSVCMLVHSLSVQSSEYLAPIFSESKYVHALTYIHTCIHEYIPIQVYTTLPPRLNSLFPHP